MPQTQITRAALIVLADTTAAPVASDDQIQQHRRRPVARRKEPATRLPAPATAIRLRPRRRSERHRREAPNDRDSRQSPDCRSRHSQGTDHRRRVVRSTNSEKSGPARFRAEHNGIFVEARSPEHALARKLIEAGYAPDAPYQTIREDGTPSLSWRSLAAAAKWEVYEDDRGLHNRPWRPFPVGASRRTAAKEPDLVPGHPNSRPARQRRDGPQRK